MAGFKVLRASEFVDEARATYLANHPTPHVDARDIRKVTAEDILGATGLAPGELDLFEGSPPCASFSTAGKGAKAWGQVKAYSDTEQRTDDLFLEWLRLLEGLKPRAFIAENVSGLVKGKAKGWFLDILAAMKRAGYRAAARSLDAQWLGVPQARVRVIFVGIREDLGIDPPFPSPLPYRYSIREALPHLASVVHDTSGQPQYCAGEIIDGTSPPIMTAGGLQHYHFKVRDAVGVRTSGRQAGQVLRGDEPAPCVMAQGIGNGGMRQTKVFAPAPSADPEDTPERASLDGTVIGEVYDRMQPGDVGITRGVGRKRTYFNLLRPHADGPSPTITAAGGVLGAASVVHPLERRKFTIAELRRICAFPDDFVLTGSYQQQWERLGRAVPPLMMRAVAERVRDALLEVGLRRGVDPRRGVGRRRREQETA
jgi:DNA (cytosine-5)-methyltransferase 1